MKEIKILYIINHSVPYGANKALLNMLDEVMKIGICPFVITAFSGGICQDLDTLKIPYKVIPHDFSVYPQANSIRDIGLFFPRLIRCLITNYKAQKKLKILVGKIKPEIIHTNIGPDHIGFNISRKLGIPHVWHIREYQDLYFNIHPLFSMNGFIKKLQSSGNFPIAITKGIFNHYSMLENARVIYDGVMSGNNFRFESIKKKYFLFVGRIEEAKGAEVLIKAYVEFCQFNADFELFLAGDIIPSYKLELDKIINDAKLSKKIHFLGFRKDVYDLMAKATALVVPSRFEGFGFITVEAMFNGCLVIGDDSGGTQEILKKENLGILYSGHDELVTSMKTIALNGIESYFSVIKRAQEQALSLYSQEENGNKIYKFYSEILEQTKK